MNRLRAEGSNRANPNKGKAIDANKKNNVPNSNKFFFILNEFKLFVMCERKGLVTAHISTINKLKQRRTICKNILIISRMK